jgi:hypothetical protein
MAFPSDLKGFSFISFIPFPSSGLTSKQVLEHQVARIEPVSTDSA